MESSCWSCGAALTGSLLVLNDLLHTFGSVRKPGVPLADGHSNVLVGERLIIPGWRGGSSFPVRSKRLLVPRTTQQRNCDDRERRSNLR